MYNMKKIIGLIYLALAAPVALQAQDPMYTHAFMAPVYLNPAATGMADYDFRVSAIYRRQWLIVPSGMQYFSVAADKYSYEHSVGFGLMANSEQEGYIKKLSFNGTFAKQLCFGSHRLSLGIQAGMFNRQIDYGKLWFADQITNQGIITNLPSQVSPNINNRKWLPDFAAGALWVHNSGFMIGASVHHLNQADESFTNKEESKLPRRFTAETRFPLVLGTSQLWDDDILFVPGAVYSMQRKNQTISLGGEFKTHYINLGLWYRVTKNIKNSDAFSITITLDNFLGKNDYDNPDKVKGGFAFDATTNGAGFTRTAGSTEGAINWEHLYNSEATSDNRCNSSARNPIPCPPNLYRRIF
jgi:type IX secretion system PorP/SprF family membrane protein